MKITDRLLPKSSPASALATLPKSWKAKENEEPPTVGDEVSDHHRNPKVHKSMGPNEMYLRVLKELADEVAEPLSIVFEKLWQYGEVSADWKRGNITPIFKNSKKEDLGN